MTTLVFKCPAILGKKIIVHASAQYCNIHLQIMQGLQEHFILSYQSYSTHSNCLFSWELICFSFVGNDANALRNCCKKLHLCFLELQKMGEGSLFQIQNAAYSQGRFHLRFHFHLISYYHFPIRLLPLIRIQDVNTCI